MKPTGRFNKITGDEIMVTEACVVNWNKEWDELDDTEKCTFLSYKDIPFLGEANREYIETLYFSERLRRI